MSCDVFLTTFGLEIDRLKYKIPMYSSGCYDKIHYNANDFSGINMS